MTKENIGRSLADHIPNAELARSPETSVRGDGGRRRESLGRADVRIERECIWGLGNGGRPGEGEGTDLDG